MRQLTRLARLAVAGLAFACAAAAAQDFPSKPVHLVVPFPAGGAPDVVARTIAQGLGERLGQSVVVENKLGAGGNIAYEAVARAPADGHTLVFATTGIATNMSLFKKLRYDALKNFQPVMLVASGPHVLVANTSVPAKNVRELIAHAKAHPKQLSYGSSGNGTVLHLAGELFNMKAGVELQHVPYRGASLAQSDLVGGTIQLMFSDVASAQQYIQAGTLRPLAVTGSKRLPSLPDIPTLAESGVPGYEIEAWFGILAPAGTPPSSIERLNRELRAVLATPEVKQRMAALGQNLVANTPDQFAAFLRSEVAKMGEIVKSAGLAAD
jgi:tripartite-type tricarboxylate transporter receptor subunit TctC